MSSTSTSHTNTNAVNTNTNAADTYGTVDGMSYGFDSCVDTYAGSLDGSSTMDTTMGGQESALAHDPPRRVEEYYHIPGMYENYGIQG